MKLCGGCQVQGSTFRCPCNGILYCGKVCQYESWAEHKKMCPTYLETELLKKRREHGDNDVEVGLAILELGETYIKLAQYASGEAYYLEARRLLCMFSDCERIVAYWLREMGQLHLLQGKYSEARVNLSSSLDILRSLSCNSVANKFSLADTLSSIGSLCIMEECVDGIEAVSMYTEALSIHRAVSEPHAYQLAKTLLNLSNAYDRIGQLDKAFESIYEALKIMRLPHFSTGHLIGAILSNLANLFRKSNKLDQALIHMQEALPIIRRVNGEKHPNTCTALTALALIYQTQGKVSTAHLFHVFIPCVSGGGHQCRTSFSGEIK